MNNIKNLANNLADIINSQCKEKSKLLVAIDGRCASGKTTISKELENLIQCNVIHMDHFFLRPEQRTKDRLNTAGENVDHERFLEEVLKPLKNGEEVSFRPFNCKTMSLDKEIKLDDKAINIIEGSYSCHKNLFDYYDLHIFLDVSPNEQMKRIILRDGLEKAGIYESKWIPLEEKYFDTYKVSQKCEYHFSTHIDNLNAKRHNKRLLNK